MRRLLWMILASGWLASVPTSQASAQPSLQRSTAACEELSAFLPPVGTALPDKHLVDIIAAEAGSTLRMDSGATEGLSLQSRYAGSLNCQSNTLTRTTPSGTAPVTMPSGFAGGEGDLCAGDQVRLGALHSRPVLIEEDPHDTLTDLLVSVRQTETWTPTCRLAVRVQWHYRAVERFCQGDLCDMLERFAVRLTDAQAAAPPLHGRYSLTVSVRDGKPISTCVGTGCPPTWQQLAARIDAQRASLNALTPDRQLIWNHMLALADQSHLYAEDLAMSGGNVESGLTHSYFDSDFLPMVTDKEILLAKIGIAGRGDRFGSGRLFSVYRLRGDALEPVAGFYLGVATRTLIASEFSDPHDSAGRPFLAPK